jgi:glycosyltransferase EpsF
MNKVKVLHVTGAMNRGGAEVMIMNVFRNISENCHFDFLINYNKTTGKVKGDFDDEIVMKGGQLFHIPAQWEIGPWKYYQYMRKIIAESRPDIVHIHMNSKSGIIAWAAKKAGAKFIITHAHADIKFRGSLIYRTASILEMKMQKFLINQFSDYFWGCSVEANKSLYLKIDARNATIINNAVDTKPYQNIFPEAIDALRTFYKIEDKTIIIGNVGRVVRHKNVIFIIDVIKKLIEKGLDCKFVFAGRADEEVYLNEIFDKISSYQLDDKVIYLGLRDDIPLVMSSFDIFVGPALKEGFGLVAVEAQAAGLPCVLYNGFPKSVDMQLDLVTFMDTFSVDAWVDAILIMRALPQKDKILIREKIIELGFDSETNTKDIEKKYLKILPQHPQCMV